MLSTLDRQNGGPVPYPFTFKSNKSNYTHKLTGTVAKFASNIKEI